MQPMQTFYERLFSDTQERDSRTQELVQLTQIEPDQITTIDNASTWTGWGEAD